MWKPASPCLDCGYLNDANFKVCQRCRLSQVCSVSRHPSRRLKIDFQAIDDRLVHLAEVKSNKSYERQKSSLQKELINFLSSLPVPKALSSASPSDIKKFLSGRITQRRLLFTYWIAQAWANASLSRVHVLPGCLPEPWTA